MPNPSKNKGSRFEREIVELARSKGLAAKRVPLSGAAEGYPGDVQIRASWGADWCLEAKWRGDGFRELYKWIEGKDGLVVRADHKEALLIVRLSAGLELFQ